MIIEIPTEADFKAIGMQLLNVAWDTAASLLCDLDEADYFEVDTDEVKDAYWHASKIHLSTALSIAQQGSEFLIKSKIARISPFLLFGSAPKDWPKGSSSKPIPFSDFRTIDAQDLIKVHDSVHGNSLSEEFKILFEDLRRKRNSIMHSIDKHLTVHVIDLILAILSINQHLGESGEWVKIRKHYLQDSPLSQMHSEDYADYRIVWEFDIVRNILPPSDLKKYFSFDKKRRNYICPNCAYGVARDAEREPKTAMLKPNKSDSTAIWCFVCGESQEVERNECTKEQCNGNVLSLEYGRCLTCGGHVD